MISLVTSDLYLEWINFKPTEVRNIARNEGGKYVE
jgi:hypothetical protein